MKRIRKYLLLVIVVIVNVHVSAQTIHENSGWMAWFSSYKLSVHWGLHFDGQVRSADNWAYVRSIILRPGVTYFFNAKNNVTVGYAYVFTNNPKIDGAKNTVSEHRIWQQYIYTTTIRQVWLQNRFRLEQRFIERPTENVFAQRFRYFVRTIIPLAKNEPSFNQGFFVALQNEIYLNIQNKEKINNSFFDQNRIYSALGYRFSPKVDLESGYMNQYTKGMTRNVSNNIIQLALYTRL